MYSVIDEELRVKVGLERLYDYHLIADLNGSNGEPISGQVTGAPAIGTKTRIILRRGIVGKRLVAIYLHEVAHVIAADFDLEEAPGAYGHNRYFAVLVAVMYRRANILDLIQLYDFGDTEIRFNGEGGPLPDDKEIIDRLRYILSRSASFAFSNLTIEKIAEELCNDLALEVKNANKNKKDSINWPIWIHGFLIGGGITACAATLLIMSIWIRFTR